MTKVFDEQDLFAWPLTPDSLVLEIGAHEGQFIHILTEKFDCRVYAFEPVPEFFNACVRRFAANPKVTLWPFALGESNRRVSFQVKGSMSGLYESAPNETIGVAMRDVAQVVQNIPDDIALLSCNAEGSEMSIFERLLDEGLIARFAGIQIQPHACVPDAAERWAKIRERLAATHEMVFDSEWCWSGFSLRK